MRRFLSTLILVSALPALTVEASAAGPRGNFDVLGNGTVSCGSWLAERKTDSAMSYSLFSWVQGFLSGYNAYGPTQKTDVTAGIDPAGLKAWLDNYCTTHPLETLGRAADDLSFELGKRK